MFYCLCFFLSFFSFFSPRNLRAPSADRRETLPRMSTYIIQVPKFGKISDNFKLRPRISPERIEISKIGKLMYRQQSLLRSTKKSGELWSTNNKVGHASLDPPKSTFWKTLFRPLRGAAPSNLHTLDIDQGLLSCLRTPNRRRWSRNNF